MAASEGRIFQNGTKKVVKSSSKWETQEALLKLCGSLGFFFHHYGTFGKLKCKDASERLFTLLVQTAQK
jgi:hypothetical protein